MARSAHVKNRMHPTDDRLIDRHNPIIVLVYEKASADQSTHFYTVCSRERTCASGNEMPSK